MGFNSLCAYRRNLSEPYGHIEFLAALLAKFTQNELFTENFSIFQKFFMAENRKAY